MKGKVTKDIFLRVGSGMVRIPRIDRNDAPQEPKRHSAADLNKSHKSGQKQPIDPDLV